MATITATEIVARTTAAFADMADASAPSDWTDGDSYRRYVSTLRTGKAWATGPRSVVATVAGPDANLWGYTAGDALDAAGDTDEVFATGHINQTGPASWVLTW
ncbi:hypothetical protein ACWFMI_25110 [Nocardiopsis terrae]|uniref:hypothetical protein n=1 Tax=Streptomyces sp. NPDC057554 TaxID=3350538 RepID=UPI0036BFD67A